MIEQRDDVKTVYDKVCMTSKKLSQKIFQIGVKRKF